MDEDEVIQELPVYLSKALSEKLHLIQYPLRPATVPFEDDEIAEVKIKPNQTKLQVSVNLETDCANYDVMKGENFALHALGYTNNDYVPDPIPKLDKQVFEATPVSKLGKTTSYVAGIVKGNEVYLTPLKSILQMKNTLPYLKSAKSSKSVSAGAESGGENTEEEAEEEATKVTVKFSRDIKNSDKSSKNYVSARKKDEQEPWTELQFLNSKSECEKLCSRAGDNESPFYILPQDMYLPALFPKHKEQSLAQSVDKGKANYRISIVELKELPLTEQLRVILLNGKVLQFSQIWDFLKTKLHAEFDEVSLLKAIQTVATLVQGCWVVRSEIAYGDEFISSANGISGPLMQRARDITLAQFTETRVVERKKIGALTRLPHEEVTEILSNVARMVPKKGWEFLMPYDSEFVNNFPTVVERQRLIWEVVKNQQARTRRNSERDDRKKGSSMSPPRKVRTKSFSSDTDSGAETDSSKKRRSRKNSEKGSNLDLAKIKIEKDI